jgi:hypothetical protein
MKNVFIWMLAVMLASCKQAPVSRPIHMIAIEANGAEVSPDMLSEGFTPSRIYCYIVKDGKRIKDGQEFIFIDKRSLQITEYIDGNVVNSDLLRSFP